MTQIDGERMKRLKALMAEEEEPAPTKTLSMREKLELALASAEKSVSAQFKAEDEVVTLLAKPNKGVGGVTLRELLESAAKGEFKTSSATATTLGAGQKAGFSAAKELEKLRRIKELADKTKEAEREAAIQAYNEAVKEDLIKQSEPEPERPDSFGSWA